MARKSIAPPASSLCGWHRGCCWSLSPELLQALFVLVVVFASALADLLLSATAIALVGHLLSATEHHGWCLLSVPLVALVLEDLEDLDRLVDHIALLGELSG